MRPDDIKNLIADFLNRMTVVFDEIAVVEETETGHHKFVIKTNDSKILIGAKGEHLLALNHLVKRVALKGQPIGSTPKFIIDVNDYQQKLFEDLKMKAKIMSDRARSFKVNVELEPMSSYERMLVHSYLDKSPDIKTESQGEGSNRRVIIKYISPETEII